MRFSDISIGVPIYASDFGDFFIPIQKFSDKSCSGICYTLSDVEMFYVVYNDEEDIDSNDACGAFRTATKKDFVSVQSRIANDSLHHDIIDRLFNYQKT